MTEVMPDTKHRSPIFQQPIDAGPRGIIFCNVRLRMILITGASGNVGGAVLQELLQSGTPVRSMYRSGEDASRASTGANPVIADFADRSSLDRALEGVDRVYLVCSPIPQLVELESNMVNACREHGIRHLVLNSALGADTYNKSFPAWHREVEERVRASGVPATILRPDSFMQNITTYFAGTINSEGAFYVAGEEAPIGFVDVRDIGAVAAKVSAALGRAVRYVAVTQEQLRQSLRDAGMPPWQVEALADLQAYYTDGPGGKVSSDVGDVLGREPIRMDQFLRDYAFAFTAIAKS